MSDSSTAVIRRYLEDAIAAEASFETQLRAFSKDGDDEEVQAAFAHHADQTQQHQQRLTTRLQHLGGSPSTAKSFLAHVRGFTPRTAQAIHQQEERTTQNLIMAFSVENVECAMYEALATVANTTGDIVTEALAREIQAEERQAADKLWHFLPSRSKIAFNMLTAGEIDPSIETRAPENRLV